MTAATRVQPEGRPQTTTITENGKTTEIVTDASGKVMFRENGKVTSVIDPQAIARQAAEGATAAMAPHFPEPAVFHDDGVPETIVKLVVMVMSILAIIIIGLPISRAFARRMDRKAGGTAPDTKLDARLDRIEQAIETMAVEVERVSEAQRYSARLLTERLPDTPARSLAGADPITR